MIDGIDPNIWEECTQENYANARMLGEEAFFVPKEYGKPIYTKFTYFKKKSPPKFPKVFEDDENKISIVTKHKIDIQCKFKNDFVIVSSELLKQALKYQEDNS